MTHLEHLEAKAQELGRLIGSRLPDDVGFVLTLCNFGDDGFCTYVSNQNRADTIRMLAELILMLRRKGEKKVYPFEKEPD